MSTLNSPLAARPIAGRVEPGFEPVREAFERNFDETVEVGAGLAIFVGDRCVVDLTGGWLDPDQAQRYGPEHLQLVFSTTKGVTATCLAVLAGRGSLDYDQRVSHYWPEFSAADKGDITVAQLLSHQAGLPTIDAKPTLAECLDWATISGLLAQQTPMWNPGTAHGYHALTYGWLAGELLRRIDGRNIGRFVQEELSGPLGLELWIGLPAEHESRVAPLLAPAPLTTEMQALVDAMMGPESLGGRALSLNGAFSGEETIAASTWNGRAVHAAEIPAANGITNARSLAAMYANLGRVVPAEVLQRAATTVSTGPDKCLHVETTFGMGFMTHGPFTPMAGPGSFGHAGAGGSLAFASPQHRLGFGYVMNQMDGNLAGDPRAANLIEAVLGCL